MKTIPNLHQVFGGANGSGRLALGVRARARRLVVPGDRGVPGVVKRNGSVGLFPV
jgi:hypothetical protein